MKRTIGRLVLAGAASALIVIGSVFIPVSYDVCVGSVVETELPVRVLDIQKLEFDGDRAEFEEQHARLEEKARQLIARARMLEENAWTLKAEEFESQEKIAEMEKHLEDVVWTIEALEEKIQKIHGEVHSRLDLVEDRIVLRTFFLDKDAREAEHIIQETITDHIRENMSLPEIRAEEFRCQIGGNILAWASGGRIVINAEGLSPDELAEKIEEELIRRGAGSADVTVEVTEDSLSVISISIEDAPADMLEGDSLTIEIRDIGGEEE